MSLLASTILTEARGLLNDPSGAIYPDTPMFTLANKVYRELQTKLSSYGISTTKEVSAAISVPLGVTRLGDGALLPADLLYPKELKERAVGEVYWHDMEEKEWEPDAVQGTYLIYWTWREDEIKFLGSTSIREVLIKYVKTLGTITSGTSPILILGCETWLSQRLATVAAMTVGANPTRAQALAGDLEGIWDDFIGGVLRRKQTIPVRRRRTRYRVP